MVLEVSSCPYCFWGPPEWCADFHEREERSVRLFSLLDTAAREFGPVMVFQNDAVARRWLQESLPPNGLERRRAYDFVLYDLGAMDMATGVIASTVPEVVASLPVILEAKPPTIEEMADGTR